MARTSKPKSPQVLRNRNNKERGKAFEIAIAKALGWYVVPYSGVSSVFGWCDVRDTEDKNSGYWLCECKTMTPDNPLEKRYTIEQLWLNKLLSRSNESKKLPILAFTMYSDVHKFIAMPIELLHIFSDNCPYINPVYYHISIKRKSVNHKNYTIDRSYVMHPQFRSIRREKLNTVIWSFGFEDEENGSGWVIMHLNDFIRFYHDKSVDLIHRAYYGICK